VSSRLPTVKATNGFSTTEITSAMEIQPSNKTTFGLRKEQDKHGLYFPTQKKLGSIQSKILFKNRNGSHTY
jgi:hypothetical protein